MIVDINPSGFDYDAKNDVATLTFPHAPPSTTPPSRTVERTIAAQLLLDANGYLVGVDLGDAYSGRRIVAMLGPHEAVATVREARVLLDEEGPKDNPDSLVTIRIEGARAAIRAAEKSPYQLLATSASHGSTSAK